MRIEGQTVVHLMNGDVIDSGVLYVTEADLPEVHDWDGQPIESLEHAVAIINEVRNEWDTYETLTIGDVKIRIEAIAYVTGYAKIVED